jgi:hypothetical protein
MRKIQWFGRPEPVVAGRGRRVKGANEVFHRVEWIQMFECCLGDTLSLVGRNGTDGEGAVILFALRRDCCQEGGKTGKDV